MHESGTPRPPGVSALDGPQASSRRSRGRSMERSVGVSRRPRCHRRRAPLAPPDSRPGRRPRARRRRRRDRVLRDPTRAGAVLRSVPRLAVPRRSEVPRRGRPREWPADAATGRRGQAGRDHWRPDARGRADDRQHAVAEPGHRRVQHGRQRRLRRETRRWRRSALGAVRRLVLDRYRHRQQVGLHRAHRADRRHRRLSGQPVDGRVGEQRHLERQAAGQPLDARGRHDGARRRRERERRPVAARRRNRHR
jgi:hypothetical protein